MFDRVQYFRRSRPGCPSGISGPYRDRTWWARSRALGMGRDAVRARRARPDYGSTRSVRLALLFHFARLPALSSAPSARPILVRRDLLRSSVRLVERGAEGGAGFVG